MPAFPTANIVMIVAANDGKFCVTDENSGWFLPGGYSKYGETFAGAAKREALKDAGIDVTLDGILRIEYSFDPGDIIRFRCLYAATPTDPEAPLKSVPDDETNGATWFTYVDVLSILKKPKSMVSKIAALPNRLAESEELQKKRKNIKEKLRSKTLPDLLKWAQSTKKFNSDILRSIEGKIDESKTQANYEYVVHLVVRCKKDNSFLMFTSDPDAESPAWTVPFIALHGMKAFNIAADDITKKLIGLLSHSLEEPEKNKGATCTINVTGISGIYHLAPQTDELLATGKVIVSFCAEADLDPELYDLSDEYDWMSLDEINALAEDKIEDETKRVILNTDEGLTVPTAFLCWEGSEYRKFE